MESLAFSWFIVSDLRLPLSPLWLALSYATFSKTPAAPIPPPTHMVTKP